MTKLQKAIAMLFLTIGMILPLSIASAEESLGDEIVDYGKMCLGDYYNVAFTIRNEEMRRNYFKDAITMSWCQLNDVLPLYEEYESIKDQFRADAANCGTVADYDSKIAGYESEMVRNLLEVYFIRNVKVEARETSNISDLEERKLKILSKLKNDMVKKFVTQENMTTEDELDIMFENWTSKYSDTIIGYSQCAEGPIAELSESWDSFLITMQSIDLSIDAPERQSFMDVVKPDVETSEDFDNVVQSVVNAWDKFTGNVEEAEQARGIEEAESKTDFPDTFSAYLEELKESSSDDDTFEASAKRMAEYKILYGEISATSTKNTSILLDQLNQVINNNNVQDFPAIREALGEIYGKQCSG
ncbi:MAG: hypothetical protein ACI9QC_000616 [Oceanicoccus sp.]|jgi:hypothetical protein